MNGSHLSAVPVLNPEPYITRADLADLMGVSERTIDRWLAEPDPIPSETWGLRSRRFRASEAMAWARARARRAA